MPLFWLSISFLAGILFAAWRSLPIPVWLVLIGLAFFFALYSRRISIYVWHSWGRFLSRLLGWLPFWGVCGLVYFQKALARMRLPPAWLLVTLCLGGYRYQAVQPVIRLTDLAYYNDSPEAVVLEGWLMEPPDLRDQFSLLRIQVDRLRFTGEAQAQSVSGQMQVRAGPGVAWAYGDRLRLEGWLAAPPEQEDFSYRQYLARQGIYSYMATNQVLHIGSGEGNRLAASAYRLRQHALELVSRFWPDPEASLFAGILLGVEKGIPADVAEAFRDTGTAHIIAISGSNIAILAGFISGTLGRWLDARRRFWVAGFSALLVLGYAFMVGADAAVVRAAVMGGLALFAVTFGRRPNGLNSLAFVGAIMALINPNILWDVSFQLSFMATLGLVLFAGPFSETFHQAVGRWWGADWASRLSGPVGEYILYTLAAQLTTLPVILAQFERLSGIALLANPLILPAQPLVMATGGLALLTGLLIEPVGQVFAWFAWPLMRYTIAVVEELGKAPGAAWTTGPVSPALLLAYTAMLLSVGLLWKPLKGLAGRVTELAGGKLVFPALLTLAVGATLVWRAGLQAPDERMHLYVLDAGGGEALLIQTPSGRYALVNGGRRASLLSAELGRRLPLFDRQIDWLVVGGARDEQIGALPVNMERYSPGAVLWAGPTAGSSSARTLYSQLLETDLEIVEPQVGQALDLGEGARLEFLAITGRGAVLALEWDNFRVLLPVGMDFEALEGLLACQDLGPLSALLLADSGYAPLNPPELFDRMQPAVVLLSVEAGNREGLPSPEVLKALQGYTLLRTDRHGWIEITTDGEQMWVEVERK